MKKVNSVEEYLESQEKYSKELSKLRAILNSTELEETIKWGIPTYCINNKNVLGLGAFKNHFGLWFFQGVFLKDEKKLLINAQENKTKAMRQMRFESLGDIDKSTVLNYVLEAIENQKAGKEIKPDRKKKELVIPDELKSVLDSNQELKQAFLTLSPFKQKEYSEHIANAKRESTKQSRIEKITPMILNGVGLNDKYR